MKLGARLAALADRWWAVLALVVLVPLVWSFGPETYAIQGYTDHLRHEYTAWSWLHIGMRVYSEPVGSWQVPAAHPHPFWKTIPHAYPWGSIVLFLPSALAANNGLLPDPFVHAAAVVGFSLAGIWATRELWRALVPRYDRSLAVAITALGGTLLVFWGLNGFFDPLVAGLALAGVRERAEDGEGTGFVALGAALALHYRAWYLLPVLAATAWRLLRQRGAREPRVWVVAASMAVGLVGLVLNLPSFETLREAPGFQLNPLALTDASGLKLAVIALVVAAVMLSVASWERALVPTLTLGLAIVLVVGVSQWQVWYPLLLLPLLPLFRNRAAQGVVAASWLALAGTLHVLPGL